MLNEQQPQPIGGVHGTAVGSVGGAAENGVGIVGVYPQAVLQSSTRAAGSGTQIPDGRVVAGFPAASEQGPGVISISFGGDGPEPQMSRPSSAVLKGPLVVAAAGNDGDSGNPLAYPGTPHVSRWARPTPRTTPSLPSRPSPSALDVAAPGVAIVAAVPFSHDPSMSSDSSNLSGTSFATPLVSSRPRRGCGRCGPRWT